MSKEDKLNFLKLTHDQNNYNNNDDSNIKKFIKESKTQSFQDLADFTKANSFILSNKTIQAEFSRC